MVRSRKTDFNYSKSQIIANFNNSEMVHVELVQNWRAALASDV